MSSFDPVYRLTVYDDTALSSVLQPESGAPHSDGFKVATAKGVTGFQPYLFLPRGPQGELDLRSKVTSTGRMEVELLDKRTTAGGTNLERWVSAFAGKDDKPQLAGKRARIEESVDGGSSWEDFFTGVIHEPEFGRLKVTFTLRDFADLQKGKAFVGQVGQGTQSSPVLPQLVPIGLYKAFGPLEASEPLPGTMNALSGPALFGSYVELDESRLSGDLAKRNLVTKKFWSLVEAVQPTLGLSSLSGDITTEKLLAHVKITSGARSGESGLFKLSKFKKPGFGSVLNVLSSRLVETASRGDGHHRVQAFGISELDASHPEHLDLPPDGVDLEWRILGVTEPDDKTPLLIEAHPVELWADLLDGLYGYLKPDGTPFRSVPRNTAAFNALIADSSLVDGRWVIQEPAEDRREWIEDHICKPWNLGWKLNGSGEVVPLDLRAPSSPTAPTIGQSALSAGDPEMSHQNEDAITQVTMTFYSDRVFGLDPVLKGKEELPDIPTVGIESSELTTIVLMGDPEFEEDEYEIDALGHRYVETEDEDENQQRSERVRRQLTSMALELEQPFARGARKALFPFRRGATNVSDCEVGDLRIIDLDEMPDWGGSTRGGPRLMRCTSRNESGAVVWLGFIDIGSTQQADPPSLADPTVGSLDGRFTVDQGVTLNALDEPARIEYAITETSVSTRPAEGSQLWTLAEVISADGTVTIEDLPSGKRVWTRGRSVPPGKAPSDWVFPAAEFVDLNNVAAITGCAASNISGSEAELAWSNGVDDLQVLLSVTNDTQGTTFLERLLPAGTEAFTLTGLNASDAYTATMRHKDPFTGLGPACSVSFGAGASPLGLPRMGGISPYLAAFQGEGDLGFAVWLFPGDGSLEIEVQIADDDPANVGDPDLSSARSVVLPPGSDRYVHKSSDWGDLKHARARHIKDGYDPGEWTSWVNGVVRALPTELGPRPREPVASLDLTLDRASGDVRAIVDGDDGIGSVRYATSKTDYPSQSDALNGTLVQTDSVGDADIDPIGNISLGETLFVTMAFYRSEDGSGIPEVTLRAAEQFIEAEGQIMPTVHVDPTQAGSTGTLTLTVVDEQLRVTAVEFQKKVGGGSFGGSWLSSWDSQTGTAGTDEELSRVESVGLEKKHNSAIKYRVRYTGADGTEKVLGDTVEFDIDLVAELRSLTAIVNEDGSIEADVVGDEDTAKVYLTVESGTSPSDPADPTSANAQAVLASREGTVSLPGTVPVQGKAIIKARGENASGELAPADTTLKATGTRGDSPDAEGLVQAHVTEWNMLVLQVKVEASLGPESVGPMEVAFRSYEKGTTPPLFGGWGPSPQATVVVRSFNGRAKVFEYKARDAGLGNRETETRYLSIEPFAFERGGPLPFAPRTLPRPVEEGGWDPRGGGRTLGAGRGGVGPLNPAPVYPRGPAIGTDEQGIELTFDEGGQIGSALKRSADATDLLSIIAGLDSVGDFGNSVKAAADVDGRSATEVGKAFAKGAQADPDDARSVPRDADGASVEDATQEMRSDGVGRPTFRQHDGTFNLKPGTGFELGFAEDGDGVNFGVSREKAPQVTFPLGGGILSTSSLTQPYGPAFKAKNKSASGFTAELKLRETAGTITTRTITSWTDPGSTWDLEANKSQSAEAWDDQYTLRHHLFISGTEFSGECFGRTEEVEYYYDKGSGWVLDDTVAYSSGCTNFDSDVQFTMSVDGMGAGSDFAVHASLGNGNVTDPDVGDAVEWEEASDPAEVTATPSGASSVPWLARA